MKVYLDTSVVLRRVLAQGPAPRWWGRWRTGYASEIMGVEARRALDRLRLAQILNDAQLANAHDALIDSEHALDRVSVTTEVLQRASLPMPTSLKTLDAIHLASCILIRENGEGGILFATHDEQQARAARALGFALAR